MKSKAIIYDCWNLFDSSNLKLKKKVTYSAFAIYEKKDLITGGTGFIGSAIAKLIALENDVVIVDNNQRGFSRRLNIIKNKIDFKNFDVRDEKKH